MEKSPTPPVLIVGAGPTGLTLACCLAQYGIDVRIIDRRLEPISTSNALAVHARTLEIFAHLGIITQTLARGFKLHGVNLYAGGETLAHLRFEQLQSRYPFVLGLPQHDTEKCLTQKLSQLGVEIERGVECVDWQQNPQAIEVTLKKADGNQHTQTFHWLMDCAGSHDNMRKKLNLRSSGQNLPQHFIMTDVHLTSPLSTDELHAFFSVDGPLAFIRFSQHFVRIIAEISHDERLMTKKQINLDDFKRLITERAHVDMTLSNPSWISQFTIHSRFYAPYRHQRVFLLGDAAHHHSPVGGQGMNTGIQDAFNLAWKLALVIKAQAQPALLSSYAQEREPIGKALVKSTAMMTRVVGLHNRLLQKVRNKVFELLIRKPNVRENIINQLAELSVHYRHSPWVSEISPKQPGPKAGERAPDGEFVNAEGTTQRLYQLQSGLKHLLLLFPGAKADENTTQQMRALQAWCCEHYSDSVDVVMIPLSAEALIKAYQLDQPSCYLIRPDLMIGYRSANFTIEGVQSYFKKFAATH